jgi:hypothetical protein
MNLKPDRGFTKPAFRNFAWFLLFLALRSLSAQTVTPTVDYRVTPLPTQGGTASLLVSVSLIGNPSGSTSFTIPTVAPMFGKSQSEIGEFSVSGGTIVSQSPDDLVIQHVPGAKLSVRYSVTSPADAVVDGSSTMSSLPVRRGWFAGFGWGFLIIPKEKKADQATFGWGEIPAGVKHFDTFGTAPMTVGEAEQRFIVGGSDVEEWYETLNGALLRFVGVGHLPGSPDDFRAFVRTTLIGEHKLLQDKGGDYLVAFISLPPSARPRNDFAASGSIRGLLAYGYSDNPLSFYRSYLTHEAFHYWLPSEIGGMPDDSATSRNIYRNWISEGLDDAMTERFLLRMGEETLEEYAATLNKVLLSYAKSSARNMAAKELDQAHTIDAFQIAYSRGELASLVFDDMLTKATGRKAHLEDVVRQAIVTARANTSAHREVPADVLFPQTIVALGGPDVTSLIDRFMAKGEIITLPADIFAGCATVSSVPSAPSGGATTTAQHVEIIPTLTPSQRTACTQRLAGIE